MNKNLDLVKEFHLTFGAPVLNDPQIPEENRVKLRLALILEELSELAEASGASAMFKEMMLKKVNEIEDKPEVKDPVEALDALCDLQVVLNGSIHEFGWQGKFDEAFEEVHSSNMSKACLTEEEGIKSVAKYKELGVDTILKEVNGKFVIYRASDNKILKGINFFTPDLNRFLKEQVEG